MAAPFYIPTHTSPEIRYVDESSITEFTDITPANVELCYHLVKSLPLTYYKLSDEVYPADVVIDRHKLGWMLENTTDLLPKIYRKTQLHFNRVFEEVTDSTGAVTKMIKSIDAIKDHKMLDPTQIYANMYGALQKVIQDKEKLEETVTQQQAQLDALLAWAKTQGYSA
jgi:hypothetical protein